MWGKSYSSPSSTHPCIGANDIPLLSLQQSLSSRNGTRSSRLSGAIYDPRMRTTKAREMVRGFSDSRRHERFFEMQGGRRLCMIRHCI